MTATLARVSIALVALALVVSSCGSTSRGRRLDTGGVVRAGVAASTGSGGVPLLGDEDNDANPSADYYDSDDRPTRSYGHSVGPAERHAIATLVRRYYAAAAAGDGATACGLTYYLLAESIPEDYGRPPGPLYLRGASTCAAVLSLVFKHFRAQLATPPAVTDVRVSDRRAAALLGWTSLPAGSIELRREGRVWKIDQLLAAPLP